MSTTTARPTSAAMEIYQRLLRAATVQRARRGAVDFPQRHYSTFEQAVPADATSRLSLPGLKRTRRGLTITEPTKALSPYLARGFGDDPGIFERMSRSDPILLGSLALISRETARAEWVLETPSRPSAMEAQASRLCRRYLGFDGTPGWLRRGWAHHIGHVIRTALAQGFSAYEVVWSDVEWGELGQILVPSKLVAIPPQSVWGWVWNDQTHELAGLLQVARRRGAGVNLLGRPAATIPADRLLLYTHQADPDQQPEGLSALRPAWIWWRAKVDTLLRFQEGQEQLFGGVTSVDEIAHPKTGDRYPSITKDDYDEYDRAMDHYDAGTLRYFLNPLGLKISQQHPEYKVPSPEDILAYCDLQMSLTFNAQLIGTPSTPGATMSQPTAQLLFNAIDGTACGFADVFSGLYDVATSGILQRLVDANVPGAAENPAMRYPRLRPVGLQHQSLKDFIDAITKGQQFRALHYSVATEELIRRMANLPPLTEDERDLRERWSHARLESEILTLQIAEQDRQSETATQAPIEAPDQQRQANPDGGGDGQAREADA